MKHFLILATPEGKAITSLYTTMDRAWLIAFNRGLVVHTFN